MTPGWGGQGSGGGEIGVGARLVTETVVGQQRPDGREAPAARAAGATAPAHGLGIAGAGFDRFADAPIGDGAAVTDVHGLPRGQGLVGGSAGRADDGGDAAGRQLQRRVEGHPADGGQPVADPENFAVGAGPVDDDPNPADPAHSGPGRVLWNTNHDL
jgi:hypothetical protein